MERIDQLLYGMPFLLLQVTSLYLQHDSYSSIYLCLSRNDDDDVRDVGKHDFRSVLLHPMSSNANSIYKEATSCFSCCDVGKYISFKGDTFGKQVTNSYNIDLSLEV